MLFTIKEITLEDIWQNYNFYPKSYRGLNSMNDGEFYTQIKNGRKGKKLLNTVLKMEKELLDFLKVLILKLKE